MYDPRGTNYQAIEKNIRADRTVGLNVYDPYPISSVWKKTQIALLAVLIIGLVLSIFFAI